MRMDPAIDQLRIDFQPGSLMVLNVILGILMFGVALDIKVERDPRGPASRLNGSSIIALQGHQSLSSGGNLSKIFHIAPISAAADANHRPGQTLLQRKCSIELRDLGQFSRRGAESQRKVGSLC